MANTLLLMLQEQCPENTLGWPHKETLSQLNWVPYSWCDVLAWLGCCHGHHWPQKHTAFATAPLPTKCTPYPFPVFLIAVFWIVWWVEFNSKILLIRKESWECFSLFHTGDSEFKIWMNIEMWIKCSIYLHNNEV